MRTERLFIFTLFTLFSFIISAQNDFRDGYIVTSSKDTLRGALEYRSDKRNYFSCRFRSGMDVQLYSPEDITGYGYVNDKYYSSLIIKGSFVEVLVSGKVSLYKSETNFYLQKTGEALFKLEQKENKTELREGRLIIVEDARWKGIINYLVYDCVKTKNASKDLKFNEESITKFILKYNICTGSEYIDYKANKPWSKLIPGFSGGILNSKVRVIDVFNYLDYLPDQYQSSDPFVGFVLEFSSPRLSEKVAIETEVQLIKQVFSEEVRRDYPTIVELEETLFTLNTLSFNYSLKYKFNGNKLTPFIQGGGTYDYLFRSNTEFIEETVFLNEKEVTTSYSNPFDFKKYQLGFWAGIGLSKRIKQNKLAARIRYSNTTLFSAHQEMHANNYNFSFSLSFTFE